MLAGRGDDNRFVGGAQSPGVPACAQTAPLEPRFQSFNFGAGSFTVMIAGAGIPPVEQGVMLMNLPHIQLSALPDLDAVTGIFGSIGQHAAGSDDSVVVIMVFLYDILNPGQLL